VVVEPPERLADGESVRIAREGSADSDNNE
jgi:hypothetical protein